MKQSERRYRKVKFVQITSGGDDEFGNACLYGLTKEGAVYSYSQDLHTWVPLAMFAGKSEDEL